MKKISKIFAFILVFFNIFFYTLCRKCFLLKVYTCTCLRLWPSLPLAFFLPKKNNKKIPKLNTAVRAKRCSFFSRRVGPGY